MGICIGLGKSTIKISKDKQSAALAAIKQFHNKPNDDYYRLADTQLVNDATTLIEALEAWDLGAKIDGHHRCYIYNYYGDKLDFSPLLPVLAPYINDGGVIEMDMEGVGMTVFTFNEGTMISEDFYNEDYE